MITVPAADKYSLTEILEKERIEPKEVDFPVPVLVRRPELAAGQEGWSGTLSDRWHSSDAFKNDFREEFQQGLAHFLTRRGFPVGSGPYTLEIKVFFERFEGRKRIHDDGGDLSGSLELIYRGAPVLTKRLFESLSYRDEDDQCAEFERDLGVRGIEFATVLFYRLSLGFYATIAEALLDVAPQLDLTRSGGAEPPAPVSAHPRGVISPVGPVGFLTIETLPDAAEVYVDGKLLATTPVRDARLPSGDHTLLLRKQGFKDWSRALWVVEGNRLNIQVQLDPTPP